MRCRQRVHVQGVVQGVGFRPFVYGLATQLGLTGFVGNDSGGVLIEIEGAPDQLASFVAHLQTSPPPLAHIEQVTKGNIPLRHTSRFSIVESTTQTHASTLISPDLSICTDCLTELFDPTDRRYLYPFINCTNCGPRFTITKDIPYDRPLTTMVDFIMCPSCQAEYDDPRNRRFHAQPNACAECGPQVWFEMSSKQYLVRMKQWPAVSDPIAAVQHIIAEGSIVAIKGLGGFHLACDATSDDAVRTLRQRKGRADKPLALMVSDLKTAHQIAHINKQEEALLESRQRPIVLLKKRVRSPISERVSPGNNTIGIMLPYTPLHYLLFHQTDSLQGANLQPCNLLVLTSANFSNQPIIKENDEAIEKLATIADSILLHDRDIHVHCDDSVLRIFRGVELPIRRSRGYAPFPVKLPFEVKPTLTVGGELKSTFCLADGNRAFMSQHIGDMGNLETLDAFDCSVKHFQEIFRVEPQIVACDLHPRYLSTRWANENCGTRQLVPIQHHHAHIVSLMAEHGVAQETQVIGFAFDGTGYGRDGAIWGGELFVVGYADFQSVAHLAYVPLPGGDAVIKKPYRMALAHLWSAGIEWTEDLPPVAACPPIERTILNRQLERKLNVVETSSMGRLFDAVAALAGVRQMITYEAQAAIEFEALAASSEQGHYAFDIVTSNANFCAPCRFNAAPVIRAIAEDIQQGVAVSQISMKFHRAVAKLIVTLAQRVRDEMGLNLVALSGGVFQNMLLLDLTVPLLEADAFTVMTHQLVPSNDGGLALGQAVIANCIAANRVAAHCNDKGERHEIS